MKVRIGYIAVLLITIVGLASSASACETCPKDAWNVYRCNSGAASGKEWCYGGGASVCTTGGTCGSPGPGGVENPEPLLDEPCLSCREEAPTQGFALRTEMALVEVSAEP